MLVRGLFKVWHPGKAFLGDQCEGEQLLDRGLLGGSLVSGSGGRCSVWGNV